MIHQHTSTYINMHQHTSTYINHVMRSCWKHDGETHLSASPKDAPSLGSFECAEWNVCRVPNFGCAWLIVLMIVHVCPCTLSYHINLDIVLHILHCRTGKIEPVDSVDKKNQRLHLLGPAPKDEKGWSEPAALGKFWKFCMRNQKDIKFILW